MDAGSLQLLGYICFVVIGLWLFLPAMTRLLQKLPSTIGSAMKYKSNAFLWLLTGCGAFALAWALLSEHHPKGFFVAVRVVVCFASTYAAVTAYRTKREIWVWLLGANAALYNPFVPVHLAREIWNFVGLADITLLIAAGILLRTRDESSSSADDSSNGFFSKIPWGSGIKEVKVKEFKAPSKTELWIWFSIMFLYFYGIYQQQYYSFLAGTTPSETQSRDVGYAIFGSPLLFYIVVKSRRWRHPGRMALVGFVIGMLTIFASTLFGGYAKGAADRAEWNEIVASIEVFDSKLGASLKTGKDTTGSSFSSLMAASLTHALEQAPDAAVIAFSKERLALIQIDNKGSLKRCVAAFNGVGDFGLNAQEQLRFMHAMGNLYKAASVERKTSASEAERSAATELLTAIYQKKIDPNGVLGDEKKRKALSEAEQCDMFNRLMNEIHSRPVKEGAALIRIMIAR